MQRFTILLASIGLVSLTVVAGCTGRSVARIADAGKVIMMSQDLGPTMTQSTGDHLHVINTAIDYDARAFFDDLDLLYQTNRPTRLTRWIER
ncbi:MAG: hypothetical protein V3W34_12520 [Phycisphaerae bacterium]